MQNVIFLALFSQLLAAKSLEKRGWLAFGELRGYFEPCGCNPETDLGGMVRLETFVSRERALNKSLLLFDLGNNFDRDLENYKNKFISKGLDKLDPTASLVSKLEYKYYKKFKNRPRRLLLSNAPGFKSVIYNGDVEVWGYMYSDKYRKELSRVNSQLLLRWKKIFKKKNRVLLFSGPKNHLDIFKKAKLFQLIIAGSELSMDHLIDHKQKENPNLLMRGGVRSVPLGGQGVLRGGVLVDKVALSVKELLNPKECLSDELFGCSSKQTLVSWVDKSYRVGSQFLSLEKEYNKAGKETFDRLVTSRKNELKSTNFVGSLACKSCHASAFKVWSQTRHAQAFKTLKNVKKHNDPECVSCHVLAYKDKGGFVSEELSPQFKDVTCENCHGPRKDHIKNPKIKVKSSSKTVCVSCHHSTHSPRFQFSKYWEKIKHGK